MNNCQNCGAPYHAATCSYCGTTCAAPTPAQPRLVVLRENVAGLDTTFSGVTTGVALLVNPTGTSNQVILQPWRFP